MTIKYAWHLHDDAVAARSMLQQFLRTKLDEITSFKDSCIANNAEVYKVVKKTTRKSATKTFWFANEVKRGFRFSA